MTKLFGVLGNDEENLKEISYKEEKIILFIDEINTTNNLNLFVDLFNEHSFLGYSLKDNIYIIAACNPYRLMISYNNEIFYFNKKRHLIRNLVYIVNSLPLSLINYVFDFGNLREFKKKNILISL